jgi:hypothetical protein
MGATEMIKIIVLSVIALLLIFSLFRRAEVDELNGAEDAS